MNSWFVVKILFLTLTQWFSVPLFNLRSFNLVVAVESREKIDIMEAVVDFLNVFHVNASGFSVTLSLFLIFLGLLYWWVNGLSPSLSVMLQLLSVRRRYQTQSILSKPFQTVSALNQSMFSGFVALRFLIALFWEALEERPQNILVQTVNKRTEGLSRSFICSSEHQSTCKICWDDWAKDCIKKTKGWNKILFTPFAFFLCFLGIQFTPFQSFLDVASNIRSQYLSTATYSCFARWDINACGSSLTFISSLPLVSVSGFRKVSLPTHYGTLSDWTTLRCSNVLCCVSPK